MDKAMNFLKEREYSVPSHEVHEWRQTGTCSAYDVEFVAVAIDLKVPLVTADKHVARIFFCGDVPEIIQ
jgi:predicted nucleic acid-binding protein